MKFNLIEEKEKNLIASKLEFNVSQEAIAREDYYKLPEIIGDEDKKTISDIIDDEINHSIILMKLVEKYTGNKPSEFERLYNLKKKGN